jgi:hypothetical protein
MIFLRECQFLGAAMPTLDMTQALLFLDMLDPGGRHVIASEAPFGRLHGEPKWEGGATFEAQQRRWLIEDIEKRQARGSNVYYGVNRPCSASDQQGWHGKCGANDIIAIRALAFDVDFKVKRNPELDGVVLAFISAELTGPLCPSLLVDTGGGFQLIYLLKDVINVKLFRKPDNSEQKAENEQIEINRSAITRLAHEFESLLRSKIPYELSKSVKIDNMSNLDRVMRLPGTVNYPKAEKIAKGQVEALAHIAVDYQIKCDIYALRKSVHMIALAPTAQPKRPYVQRPNDPWTPYAKAKFCCEFIRDNRLADSNEWYTKNVMLPLLGEVREGNITLEQGEELFLEAISGGARYGVGGRGINYFRRQWRSHINSSRNGKMHLGSLIKACNDNCMKPPWSDTVKWEQDFQRQRKELEELKQTIGVEDLQYVRKAQI